MTRWKSGINRKNNLHNHQEKNQQKKDSPRLFGQFRQPKGLFLPRLSDESGGIHPRMGEIFYLAIETSGRDAIPTQLFGQIGVHITVGIEEIVVGGVPVLQECPIREEKETRAVSTE